MCCGHRYAMHGKIFKVLSLETVSVGSTLISVGIGTRISLQHSAGLMEGSSMPNTSLLHPVITIQYQPVTDI